MYLWLAENRNLGLSIRSHVFVTETFDEIGPVITWLGCSKLGH